MDNKAAVVADTLELLLMNQIALRAAIEEVSAWVRQRGSVETHQSVIVALQYLDTNSEAITSAIYRLRS